jgi:hypothetical protein
MNSQMKEQQNKMKQEQMVGKMRAQTPYSLTGGNI